MDDFDMLAAIPATWVAIAFFVVARRNARHEHATGRSSSGDWIIIGIFAALVLVMWLAGLDHPFWGDFAGTFIGIFIAAAVALLADSLLRWLKSARHRQ